MNQAELPPNTPTKVARIWREVCDTTHAIDPAFEQVSTNQWRIVFGAPDSGLDDLGSATVTLDIRRTPGGRIAKPAVTATYQGRDMPIKDWRMLKFGLEKIDQGRITVPEMPEARSPDQAPAIVRAEYNRMLRRSALTRQTDAANAPQVRIGFDGTHWVIGIDMAFCDCDNAECPSHYAARIYFRRNGSTWKRDIGRFFAAIGPADFSEAWRHRQAHVVELLSGELTKLTASTDQGRMTGTSAPAATSNAVTVRQSTVRRI